MEALRRSNASEGDAPNLPPQRCPPSLTARSVVHSRLGLSRLHDRLRRQETYKQRGAGPQCDPAPRLLLRLYCATEGVCLVSCARRSLRYLRIADFRVERPRVALRVRVPITSRPNPSTNPS